MSVPGILDATFQLYRDRFATFVTIALVVYVPIAVVSAIAMPAPVAPFGIGGPPAQISPASAGLMLIGSLGIIVCAIVFLPLCMAAMAHNISAAYLGENLSATDSYRRAFPRLGPLIVTNILVGLIVGFGFILCVVPGVIFLSWYFVAVPVVILEGLSATAAMARSKELVSGNLGKVVLIAVLVLILGFSISLILQVVFAFVPGPGWLKLFFQNLLPAFILPIQLAPQVLLYYDMRIRKEAFDLQMLASALQQPTMV